MEDARRFLRYVTPGVVWAVVLAAMLFISQPKEMAGWAGKLFEKDAGGAIGAVFGFVFLSGGLGFIFSAIHHRIFNTWSSLYGVDSQKDRNFLRCLDKNGLLRLRGDEASPANRRSDPVGVCATDSGSVIDGLGGEGSWRIVAALRNMILTANGKQDDRVSTISSQAHGTGAATVAAVLSAIPFLCIYAHLDGISLASVSWADFVAVAFWVVLVIVLWCNTRRLMVDAFRVPEMMVVARLNELKEAANDDKKEKGCVSGVKRVPVTINVTQADMKRDRWVTVGSWVALALLLVGLVLAVVAAATMRPDTKAAFHRLTRFVERACPAAMHGPRGPAARPPGRAGQNGHNVDYRTSAGG